MVKIADSAHSTRIIRFHGIDYIWRREDMTTTDLPKIETVREHRDQWQESANRAVEVADYLESCLETLSEGWEGKGSKAFKKKVNEVIYFARMLAHQCDSDKELPEKPESDEDSSGPEAPESSESQGYLQIWNGVVSALEDALDGEKNPIYPWCKEGNSYTIDAYDGSMPGMDYAIRLNGEDIELPTHNNDTEIPEDDIWQKYVDCWPDKGGDVDELESAGVVQSVDGPGDDGYDSGGTRPTEESEQGWGGKAFFPADNTRYEEFFVHMKLNKTENGESKETIQALTTKLSEAPQKEAEPPKTPKLFSDGGGNNGGGPGGSGGGPGGGGMPGGGTAGPGGPPTNSGPDDVGGPDDIGDGPDDIGDGPDDINRGPNDQPDPDGPPDDDMNPPDDPDNPGDPELPDQPDKPDTSDPTVPNPDDPNGPGDPGGPGGPHGPGDNTGFPGPDRDTGTETARTGGGGPGTISGGPGGGGGGIGGGTGGGAGGAGLAPGMSGGGGAGAGPGGAGAGGMGAGGAGGGRMGGGMGMMPMMGGGMGGGAGEGGDEGDRDTWLDEDDDVWGTDGDAPPPVLGGGL